MSTGGKRSKRGYKGENVKEKRRGRIKRKRGR
jgi:hypothetical protein